jgi:hypothetical protein
MVKEIHYFACDCGDIIDEIASTQMGGGIQYGDTFTQTIFLCCRKCGKLFFTDHGLDEKEIRPYTGRLTKEQILEYAPKVRGTFDSFDERNIIAEISPELVTFTLKVQATSVNCEAVVYGLPKVWIGKTVHITLAP